MGFLEEQQAYQVVDTSADEDDHKTDIVVAPLRQPADHQRQQAELDGHIDRTGRQETAGVLPVGFCTEGVPVAQEVIGYHLHDVSNQEGGHVNAPASDFIPVDAAIPGCPPRPSEILEAILAVGPQAIADRGREER